MMKETLRQVSQSSLFLAFYIRYVHPSLKVSVCYLIQQIKHTAWEY